MTVLVVFISGFIAGIATTFLWAILNIAHRSDEESEAMLQEKE